ncbi:MAG TPA: OFA family MFS transporter [Candidatus Acidoferrales bacterium]|nr:OFA family MFS transporter [Candidatus Acidoferrales bacterium]
MNRWRIALAGVFMQMALGAGYAWSVFRIPLVKLYGWTIPQVTLPFTISWFFLGCTSVLGGLWLTRKGPRVVAMVAALLWGLGVFLSSFAEHRLWWLYIAYGVVGGTGLGMGYIVPLAVLVKWFPEHRGLIVGFAVGGFGAGPLVAAPLAQWLMAQVGVMETFRYLGIAYAMVAVTAGSFMQDPPKGWRPAARAPSQSQSAQLADHDYALGEALRTWQWWALCLLVSLNTVAGLSIVSQAAPIFEEMGKVSATAAARLVAVVSVANGMGRVAWAWISDGITRRGAFVVMFLLQGVLFFFYPEIPTVALLVAVTFVIVMCYGGGYGVTPVFAADYFGPNNVGPIYGLMLVPWAFAAALGPQLFAYLRQTTGDYREGLRLIAAMLAASTIVPLLVSPPRSREAKGEQPHKDELEASRP